MVRQQNATNLCDNSKIFNSHNVIVEFQTSYCTMTYKNIKVIAYRSKQRAGGSSTRLPLT